MPVAWGPLFDEDYRGSVRFARSFGCPSGLDAGHRVEVGLEALAVLSSQLTAHAAGAAHHGGRLHPHVAQIDDSAGSGLAPGAREAVPDRMQGGLLSEPPVGP